MKLTKFLMEEVERLRNASNDKPKKTIRRVNSSLSQYSSVMNSNSRANVAATKNYFTTESP